MESIRIANMQKNGFITHEVRIAYAQQQYQSFLAPLPGLTFVGAAVLESELWFGGYEDISLVRCFSETEFIDKAKQVLIDEQVEGRYYLGFDPPEFDMLYLGPWAEVEIASSDWFEPLWSQCHNLKLMPLDLHKYLGIWEFVPVGHEFGAEIIKFDITRLAAK